MLENLKSSFFIRKLFSYLLDEKVLNIAKYNKSLQNELNINFMNYKMFSGKYLVYEENGKGVRATAVNLLGDDNLYLSDDKIYTIKVSPFNPHKCYFPPIQLYQGCSIPAKVFIFVKRIIPKITGTLFIAIAWFAYTNFILH